MDLTISWNQTLVISLYLLKVKARRIGHVANHFYPPDFKLQLSINGFRAKYNSSIATATTKYTFN
uniref:Uncharacterized protein n=1 Tax=Oryza punctata TaxID=4537 RepID=A0A0E0L665_ORYPU